MRVFLKSIIAISSLGVFIYIIWVLGWEYSESIENLISSFGLILFALLAGILGNIIAWSSGTPKAIQRTWGFIALASLCSFIAEILWFYYANILKIDPFPSLADFFYLLFYPLMLAGILCLPYLPVKREHRLMFGLDISVIMVVGSLLIWEYLLGPIVLQNETGLSGLISLAYPVGDLLILAGLISLIQRDLEKIQLTKVILLAISMISTGLADILFALEANELIIIPMAYMNILWIISNWAILLAACWQILYSKEESASKNVVFIPLLRRSLVYIAPLLGITFIFTGLSKTFTLNPMLTGTLFITLILVILIFTRQNILLRDNQQLYLKMEQQAVTDALTTLYNRHSFNETLIRETSLAKRNSRNMSLLLIDVDNFKKFNDTHGHLAGDKLLKDIALTLKYCIRSTDYLARYGGDEFVIILPDTNHENATLVASKIEQEVLVAFSNEGLGISIGVADYLPEMTNQAFISEADKNLYSEKRIKLNA